MSADTLEKTMGFRVAKAMPSAPDPMLEKRELQEVADPTLRKLGSFAPAPRADENTFDYMARLGEHAAVFGPDDRKGVNRYDLPPAALAEWVKQDLAIAEAEAERPRYSLKPGELREVVKTDRAGREVKEFYSDEQTGTKPWMEQFKNPVVKYVSGGSAGIATENPSNHYSFDKADMIPELIELQRRAAYVDSAEGRLIEAYRQVGKEPPEEALAKVRGT
jgi:hypothetical protein